jgi:hypothetical protein
MRCRAGLSAFAEATADHRSLAEVVEPRGATATEVNRGVGFLETNGVSIRPSAGRLSGMQWARRVPFRGA